MNDYEYLPLEEQLPDLTHWKAVSEFTLEEAALLLAGIDSVEATLERVEKQRLPRWKYAVTYRRAIVRAIRQGLLQTVFCAGYEEGWNEPVLQEIKPSDRKMSISIGDTVITRASLFIWIDRENIEPISCILYRNRMQKHSIENPSPTVEPQVEQEAPLCLPRQEHVSEGLSLVDEIIAQFWTTWSPDDPTTIPKKDEVIAHLRALGATQNLAEAADKICRPKSTHRARLKNRSLPTRKTP